jgi:hypothetical protein
MALLVPGERKGRKSRAYTAHFISTSTTFEVRKCSQSMKAFLLFYNLLYCKMKLKRLLYQNVVGCIRLAYSGVYAEKLCKLLPDAIVAADAKKATVILSRLKYRGAKLLDAAREVT